MTHTLNLQEPTSPHIEMRVDFVPGMDSSSSDSEADDEDEENTEKSPKKPNNSNLIQELNCDGTAGSGADWTSDSDPDSPPSPVRRSMPWIKTCRCSRPACSRS